MVMIRQQKAIIGQMIIQHVVAMHVQLTIKINHNQKKHTTTTTSSSSDGIQGEPNVLCRGKIIHHSCEPCPVGFKDTGTKCCQ
jgi:hypothetical protein